MQSLFSSPSTPPSTHPPRSARPTLRSRSTLALLLALLLLASAPPAAAIPAFARKTGLRCSACHESWPRLSNFGQAYKDNGYQIGNERDAPVYLNPNYWPIALRITPQWHIERDSTVLTDQSATGAQPVSTQGFDLTGMDLLTAGLLHKNISFLLVPSSDINANFHFESAWVRFDDLLDTKWLNLKAGKFELDNVISEKRILTLSNNGGHYQTYHYLPPIDPNIFTTMPTVAGETGASTTTFGMGDNQLGVELMGHSKDSYTRYSVSVLSSSDGAVNLPSNRSYDLFLAGSRAFNAGEAGLQRVGAFSYIGQAPTQFLTQTSTSGAPTVIPGSGYGNKTFTRTGAYGLLYYKKISLYPMYTRGTESAFVALGIPANDALPTGIASPAWNARMLEATYTLNLQFEATARYEDIRNSTQLFTASQKHFGDLDAETVAARWYPFMTSRDGLALHGELSSVHSIGTSATSGNHTTRSGMIGLDFAF